MGQMPLNFESEQQRQNWLIKNAHYFTVVRRRNMRYERTEHPTLKEALQAAHKLLEGEPTARLLIYAVYDNHDTFVRVVSK